MRTLLLAALTLPGFALAAPATEPASAARPAPQGAMLFIANAGLEDLHTLTSSIKHARAAKESGHLTEVVWMVYGRAILVLDPSIKAIPPGLRDDLAAAQAAGVRLVACGQALERFGIDPTTVQPKVEVVPNAMHEVARLVGQGYALLRY